MQVNGFLDLPLDQRDIVYVYKLTSKHTGHYYIGQTNSIKDRMYSHLSTIIKLIEGVSCKSSQPFHHFISEKIKSLHQKDRRVKIERFTRESLSVYVISIGTDKEAAGLLERYYINKHKHDKMCLNKQ